MSLDLAARQEINDVLIRYAAGIDRRDWPLLRSCFTDDCRCDYGDIGVWSSAEEITEWMRQMHEPLGHTLHRITNAYVTEDAGVARARCYVDAIVLMPDNTTGTRAVGFYDDEFASTDGGWRIAKRTFTLVRLEPLT